MTRSDHSRHARIKPAAAGIAGRLEELYRRCNQRCFVHPDPLEFLYDYPQTSDREIVGFIASSLAYGNVLQILNSVGVVLQKMGRSPRSYLECSDEADICSDFSGFVHRFARGAHLSALLIGIKKVIETDGSLQNCFMRGIGKNDATYLPATAYLVRRIRDVAAPREPGHLLAIVEKGSACKRLNLFLRWMIRSDAVDPGGWQDLPSSKLIVPLDVHMFRIARRLQLTARNQANMKTALEITEGFRRIVPEDPVRYDFSLTRLGIRCDISCDFL